MVMRRLPGLAHITHSHCGGRSNASIANDDGKGAAWFKPHQGLVLDEINRAGVGDDGVIDTRRGAVMDLLNLIRQGRDPLIGQGLTQEGRQRAHQGHRNGRSRAQPRGHRDIGFDAQPGSRDMADL